MAKAVLGTFDSSSAFQIIGNRSVTLAALNSCNGSKYLAKKIHQSIPVKWWRKR
jgi:hypothetical protein